MKSNIYKNYGGGGKKLTRKNRKYLMKLYRKNRTRKHRGGGKIDPNDTRIKLYPTQEDLDEAEKRGDVQHYLRDVTWKNHSTGQEFTEQYWMTEEDYIKFDAQMRLRKQELEADRIMKTGATMMNTLYSDEENQYWELYEAAEALVQDKRKKPIKFTGDFHEIRPRKVVFAQSDDKLPPNVGGGKEEKELPTFESTKTKLKEILEKVKPDNKYYEFSQKLNEELNKIEEKKFNEFVNNIYENFDKIMSIPIDNLPTIKQKGGMPRARTQTPRVRRSIRNDSLDCPICLDSLIDPPNQRILECSRPMGQHKAHEYCIRLSGVNRCPTCRHESTYLNAYGVPIVFNPVQHQIYNMAMQQVDIPFEEMTPEQQAAIMQIREGRIREEERRAIVRHDRLARVRDNIILFWVGFLFLFTAHSLRAALRGQHDYNYITFLAMFYGSVIVVGLWPEAPGSVSMTDQLTEFIVRIMTFLDDTGAYLGGGKKTRRKRYKRKRRTKRKMRKKRGGVGKIGNKVKKDFQMDILDNEGKPTGETFIKTFTGEITRVFKTGYNIKWEDGSSTKEKEDENLKIMTVPIGDMHQADIPQATGVLYTGDEKVQPLPAHELTPAIKPTGYVPEIQNYNAF